MGEPFKVFVVFGSTGEYSDHRSWPVRGFLSREIAERFEFGLTKAAKAFKEESDARQPRLPWNDPGADAAYTEFEKWKAPQIEHLKQEDPLFETSYTGTDYYTLEVEVEP